MATVKRRLRDTVVFSGLFGAVPRATVRATSATACRPRATAPLLRDQLTDHRADRLQLLTGPRHPVADRAEHQWP